MLFVTYLPMIISYANIIHFFECRTIFFVWDFFSYRLLTFKQPLPKKTATYTPMICKVYKVGASQEQSVFS